jgi:hypothetical protein
MPGGGSAAVSLVELQNLEPGALRLHGRHVVVRNAGTVYQPDETGRAVVAQVGDAQPDREGHYVYQQGRGGGRMDKVQLADPDFRWRYIQASRFGEVNAYFHIDRIATYVHELLAELGAPPLPRVVVIVNAHAAATALEGAGRRDGVARGEGYLPFQGGHYRLPGKSIEVDELDPLSPAGEIHLGPGRSLQEHGELARLAGGRYRANASHNPGILYHEYGHHLTRHTADLAANGLRAPCGQDNRKSDLDEGTCDYWAAAMLGTPHIWAFHHRHDDAHAHPRSLTSRLTIADFVPGRGRDKHANGTIWAAALWELRTSLDAGHCGGARLADTIVLASLLRLASWPAGARGARPSVVRRARSSFVTAAGALVDAAAELGGTRAEVQAYVALARRGIPVPPRSDSRREVAALGGA